MNVTNISIDKLSNDPEELKRIILELKNDNIKLTETVKIYQFHLFGRKSEKLEKIDQPGLFNESEIEEDTLNSNEPAEKIKISYERIKKRGRKPLPDDLLRVEKIIDIPDEEKICSCCGNKLVKFGEDISEKLEIIPQKVHVLKYIRPKYSCKNCNNKKSNIKTANLPEMLIPKGIATASSAAFVFAGKFVDGIPYYRQEKIFERIGIDLPRSTMCNWQIFVYYNYLIRLIDLMKKDLIKSHLIGVDETHLQVIVEKNKPPDSKSYMWVYRGYQKDKTILLYDYKPDRKGKNPELYLEGYHGFLQTDGYNGYNLLAGDSKIIHLACWAHVRRKFFECFKGLDKNNYPDSKIILEMIQKLYTVEKKIKKESLGEKEILKIRQEESKEVIESIKKWLDNNVNEYPPETKMGKAINYTLNLWDKLIVYLDDAMLPIDNNLVENAIRPFVVGRKNWLFSFSENGAKSSAAIYSLIETAKAHGKEPYKYLKELFEKIPYAKTDQDYEKLLPYHEDNLF